MKQYCVYVLASRQNGTLYIGVTSNLVKRIWEHKNKVVKGFISKYAINKLVYYEIYKEVEQAIMREKKLKQWPRKWKLNLINQNNPGWHDLYEEIIR